MSRTRTIMAIATLGALVAGGGWALAAGSGNVLHACASKGTGTLRLAGKCRKRERAVTWNVQGRQGRQGPKGNHGATGSPGTNGATGPSDTYAAGAALGPLPNTYTQVTSITVPAGSYLVGAKATIFGPTNAISAADCIVNTVVGLGPPAGLDEGRLLMPAVSGQTGSGIISLVGAATYTSPQTLILSCRSQLGATSFDDARIWAISTGSLHATLPLPID